MLPKDYGINCALADQKLALQVLGLVDQACPCISFRIAFRMVHVSLAVHDLVPFPVDYRASGYSDLEYVRIVGYK